MVGKLMARAGTMFVAMPSGAAVIGTTTVLALGTAWLVYATGGVRFAYLHLMYVPVVLSALAFGVPGGLLAGIAGGVLLGPLMPLSTSTGEMQQPLNWIYRLTFFAAIGALVGAGAQLLRRQLRELEWLHEHHPDTGLLNFAGLIKELDERMQNAPGQKLVVWCGDRSMTLRWKELEPHRGARAQRGAVLSRNYRKVDRLEVAGD